MNENPRMLVAICLEIFSIANRVNMLPNMLVQMLANILARAPYIYSCIVLIV